MRANTSDELSDVNERKQGLRWPRVGRKISVHHEGNPTISEQWAQPESKAKNASRVSFQGAAREGPMKTNVILDEGSVSTNLLGI